jgi:hypothetical protein
MQSHLFHVVLAVCLVGGTWCASHPALHPTAAVMENQDSLVAPAAEAVEADVIDLRTGDTFWGLHIDGVVPCSGLLVKGGGNIVTLSDQDDRDARCMYQVVHEKQIALHGKEFRLSVVAADQIHVRREPALKAVVSSR